MRNHHLNEQRSRTRNLCSGAFAAAKTNAAKCRATRIAVMFVGFTVASSVMLAACSNAQENVAPAASTAAQGSVTQENVPSLKDAFKGKFLIGTVLGQPALQGKAPMDVAIATTHFNAITPSNSMKPDALQRTEGQFTFTDADRLVELAEQSGGAPIGHALVWHNQTPKWFFEGPDGKPVTRELALARMRKHIATVVGRYKGRIKEWDVVNEAIPDGPGVFRDTPWLKAIGEDYIAEAFRAAHAADPDAILIYNDYNIEREYKRPKALQLLKSLLDQKVPIHAVGIQAHWRLPDLKLAEVEESIKQFSALGLKVMITELDIGVLPSKTQGADITAVETMTPEQAAVMNPYTAGLPKAVAQQQAQAYRQAFELFLRHKDVIGRVTFWGPHDGSSWLNNFPIRGRTDYALIFDRQGKPKPAFYAIREAAQAQLATSSNTSTTLRTSGISSATQPSNVASNVPPLKDAFKGKFLIGNALDYPALRGKAPMDVAIATRHFNAITSGNSLKPSFVQPNDGDFRWADGDRLMELAEQNGAVPIGHTLVWHQQTPTWFFEGPNGKPVTRELALARMRKHISTVVGRYKGRIKQWDVVNEAINDGPGVFRDTPWLKAIGEDYIAEAFRAARAADPDAILIYNDYNIERPYKRPKALELLKSLLAQGVPIDAVGIQGHWRLNNMNLPEVEDSIKQFAALGLKVMITELDIGVLPSRTQGADITAVETMTPEQAAVMNPYTQGLPEAVAQQHAQAYRQAFEMFLRHKDVIGRVTLWGTHDGDSWLNNFPIKGRTDYATLFDRQGKPKPAYFAVRDVALAQDVKAPATQVPVTQKPVALKQPAPKAVAPKLTAQKPIVRKPAAKKQTAQKQGA